MAYRLEEETVTAIPKIDNPAAYGQLRNISCTPLFSKILEHFVLTRLQEEVRPGTNQFGGIKGSSNNEQPLYELDLQYSEDSESDTIILQNLYRCYL